MPSTTTYKYFRIVCRYVVASGVALVCEGLLVFLYSFLLHEVASECLPLPRLESWWRLPFVNRWITELIADYALAMIAVLLASRLLAGPLVSGSYALWAWVGFRIGQWLLDSLQEPGYYLEISARMHPDPLNPAPLVPSWWFSIIIFAMALGWVMKHTGQRHEP